MFQNEISFQHAACEGRMGGWWWWEETWWRTCPRTPSSIPVLTLLASEEASWESHWASSSIQCHLLSSAILPRKVCSWLIPRICFIPPQDPQHQTTSQVGRHSGNIKMIFMSSFILHLFKYCLPITVGSVMWQLNTGEDHLDSSWVPPLRLCMTLNKLSRPPNLRAASYRGGRQYPLLGLWWGTNQSFFTMLAKPSCII